MGNKPEMGDFLCDMHDRFKYLPKALSVSSEIMIRMHNSSRVVESLMSVQGINKTYVNKMLVVVGEDYLGRIIGVYSYDNYNFGLVILEEKKDNNDNQNKI